MPSFAPDTDILVAAFCSWHENHAVAREDLERRNRRKERMVVAGHSLAEIYAVLTRLPAPHRLSPADAHALIDANLGGVPTSILDGNEIRQVLRDLSGRGLGGGLTYDALALSSVKKAGVRTVVTFNDRDFRRIGDVEVKIVNPSSPG